MHRIALVAVAVGCSLPAVAQNSFSGKVTRVEQGDQIVVKLETWQLTVRLHGIECPKSGPFSSLARDWTKARLLGTSVNVHVRGTAAKGVVFGDVLYPPGESNISIELVEQGLGSWARAYAPDRTDLAAAERRARGEHDGVWGNAEVQTIRIQRIIGAMVPLSRTKSSPPATPTFSPTPPPTPSGSAMPTVSNPVAKTASFIPILLGILGATGCLLLAERLSREARYLRERPILLTDATENQWVKVRGHARPLASHLTSVVGRIPALYLREVTQTFRDGGWQTTSDETDMVPFTLDDGLDQAQVNIEKTVYKPIRVARFYNDIPVEKWHARSYSGDVRTEIFFIPPDVSLTVYGTYLTNPKRLEAQTDKNLPVTVIEGDERRLARIPTQVALGLVAFAVVFLSLGIWFSVMTAN